MEGEGTSTAAAQVEPGTPKPLLDVWNSIKLVGLFMLDAEGSCLAAVGQDVKPSAVDFKVCVLPCQEMIRVIMGCTRGLKPSVWFQSRASLR